MEKVIQVRNLYKLYRVGDEMAKAAVLSECRKRGINDTEINWEE